MRRPGYETLDYRSPARELAAAIDAGIAARRPHLREQIATSYPAGPELRRLRRQASTRSEDPGLALRRRQLELLRLAG
jgi:hypothetical protein